ncbi:hypothetical protein DIPPA_03000 [Diplonema papillatum]|nr:hypothetical protein DIPPA_03000 [Diplonema papillatum]|eukprot:gene4909-7584_t
MSKTGTVKSWKMAYGFAETDDGTLVWIHTSEIDGGRLRVGRKVSFDTEAVEGHNGRLKGTNVSGEAVLKKGERLSDEDFESDKKLREELRDARIGENKKEFDPVYSVVSKMKRPNKMMLIKELTKELKLDDRVVMNGNGSRRPDPTTRSKKTYSKPEFIAFYGQRDGEKMWNLAGQKGRRSAKTGKKPAPKKAAEE